jgi:tetratricopeptide (TPR) repeat protein
MNKQEHSTLRRSVLVLLLVVLLDPGARANDGASGPDSPEVFLRSDALTKALLGYEWQKILEAVPNDSTVMADPRVAFLQGHAFYALGQNNAAAFIFHGIVDSLSIQTWEAWTSEFVVNHPLSPVAHYLYGDALAREFKMDKALDEFNNAVKKNGRFCLALNSRAAVHDIQGKLKQAFEDFERMKKVCPNFADLYASIGVNYLQRGMIVPAAEKFSQALKLDSTHALAYNGRACYNASKGDRTSATEDIFRATSKLSNNPYITLNARALTDSTDTVSVLGRIANLPTSGRGLRGFEMRSQGSAKLGIDWSDRKMVKIAEINWNNQWRYQDQMRKGVYVDFKSAAVITTSSRVNFATEFTIGYPRR